MNAIDELTKEVSNFNSIKTQFAVAGYELHSDFFIAYEKGNVEAVVVFKFSPRGFTSLPMICIIRNVAPKDGNANCIHTLRLYKTKLYYLRDIKSKNFIYRYDTHVVYDKDFMNLIPRIIAFLNNAHDKLIWSGNL